MTGKRYIDVEVGVSGDVIATIDEGLGEIALATIAHDGTQERLSLRASDLGSAIAVLSYTREMLETGQEGDEG